jgi:thiamine-phosphate pyrophosphorylase
VKGLYAVTPDLEDTEELANRVERALLGGASWIQYRNKSASPELRLEQGRALVPLCRRYRVPLIVNDDPALAAELGAEGVHIGSEDASIAAARAILAPSRIVGVSCYDSLARAQEAEVAGANYVAFGSFFPSPTKTKTVAASLELLREAKARLSVPVVAIGGINGGNARQVVEAGADAIAVISAVFLVPNVREAARTLAELFKSDGE